MTLFERLGVGLVLLILILDFLVGLGNFPPQVMIMAMAFVVIGFALFAARGKDD